MHPPADHLAQRLIDQPLSGDAGDAGKGRAFDFNREVRFARSVVPHMPGMLGAVVDDAKLAGRQGGGEPGGDFFGYRAEGAGAGVHAFYITDFAGSGSGLTTQENERRTRPMRFHGRVEGSGVVCMAPGCTQPGEFRAPPASGPRGDGPPAYRWFCLDHVREFNAGYNFFAGMSVEEINAAQRPYAGWERETRAFAANGVDRPPVWGDFVDPLEAISARYQAARPAQRADGKPVSDADRRALKALGLAIDADRRALRERYAELVRRYHPDRNGGDRRHEHALTEVIAAYTQLKRSALFA